MYLKRLISRKTFFKLSVNVFLVGFILLWDRIIKWQNLLPGNGPVRRIKAPVIKGITFYDDFYLIISSRYAKAFSTTCTHAGCALKQEINDIITCPCHGSQFEAASGKPLKGPAFKPLKELDCRFDAKGNEWVVRL